MRRIYKQQGPQCSGGFNVVSGCILTFHSPVEQKRRQAIREGFDKLTELVPGLEGQGRSEGLVLQRTVKYMHQQLAERRALIERVEALGGVVDPELKR